MEWDIKREPWENPEWQRLYGDEAVIEVKTSDGVLGISVCEVIEEVGLQFVIAHCLELVRQGREATEREGNLAREIAAWAEETRVRFSPPTYVFSHPGICPMCKKSTKANVHQRCGLAREAELKARRQARDAGRLPHNA